HIRTRRPGVSPVGFGSVFARVTRRSPVENVSRGTVRPPTVGGTRLADSLPSPSSDRSDKARDHSQDHSGPCRVAPVAYGLWGNGQHRWLRLRHIGRIWGHDGGLGYGMPYGLPCCIPCPWWCTVCVPVP